MWNIKQWQRDCQLDNMHQSKSLLPRGGWVISLSALFPPWDHFPVIKVLFLHHIPFECSHLAALVCYVAPVQRQQSSFGHKMGKARRKITGLSLWTTSVRACLCVWSVILERDASWGPRRCHFKFVIITPFESGWTDASKKHVGQPEIPRHYPMALVDPFPF